MNRGSLMSRHTPGPWKAELKMAEYDIGEHVKVVGADGSEILAGCGCCGSPYMLGKDPEADARLIAAAPELLEALENIANISPVTHGPEEAVDAAVRIAADAIAKAKGGGGS